MTADRSNPTILSKLAALAPLSSAANKMVVTGTALGIILVVGVQYYNAGIDIRSWDWMLISGLVVFAVAVANVDRVRPRFDQCCNRLFDRGILQPGTLSQEALREKFAKGSGTFALRGAGLAAAAIAIGFGFALWQDFHPAQLGLGVIEIGLAFVAGGYLGEMAYLGQLGRSISDGDVTLNLDPWHADQTAGMKPVGDFYFFQAGFATLPAAYLAIWLVILPLWPDYANWYYPFAGLLCVAIVLQILAIFVPMVSIHAAMLDQKRRWRQMIDEQLKENSAQRTAFLEGTDSALQAEMESALAVLANRHAQIEAMPTWPVDRKLWRRFSINNALLVLPLAADLFAGNIEWRRILTVFSQVS